MKHYYRPLVQIGQTRPEGALPLAGGWGWFSHAEVLARSGSGGVIAAADIPEPTKRALTAARADIAGLRFDAPRLMGILNVTPDSFSDGGRFNAPDAALARALALADQGADIVDIGGESTRPGADFIPVAEETARTQPVIEAIRAGSNVPVSIDTRKAAVARAAVSAGANLINDVAAFTFEPELATLAAKAKTPVCLMHAQGDPATMQNDPEYDNVLLDVFDFLEERIEYAVQAGIPRAQIMIDPGIGFGKRVHHNLALLRGISLFHALGCVVLLGASRKKFIGTLDGGAGSDDRLAGSISVALSAIAQGVQIIRAHDISETRQAVRLWAAVNEQEKQG